jgi:hypothetical protein
MRSRHSAVLVVFVGLWAAAAGADEPQSDGDAPAATPIVLHVALGGDDAWSGKLAAPNAARTDGPFATIDRARQAVRGLKDAGGEPTAVRVEIHGGTHFLAAPLRFGPEDSGAAPPQAEHNKQVGPERAVVYAAAAGERPVVSGGRRITGWTKGEVAGREAWTVDLPEVRAGRWHFTQLWVDGRRAVRPRLPRVGPEKFGRNASYRIAEPLGVVRFEGSLDDTLFTGQDAFRYAGDDLAAFHNLPDVDCVFLHFWVATRIPFAQIDATSKVAKLQRKSRMRLTDDFTGRGSWV